MALPKGFKHSPATIARLRAMRVGSKNPFYGRKHSSETLAKMRICRSGAKNAFYGKRHTQEALTRMSISRKGKCVGPANINWNKPRSEAVKKKVSNTRITLKIAVGAKNPNWRGGKSRGRKAEMATTRYKEWRKAVFKRDDYKCQMCPKRGGYLQADHIKPWAYFPELRYDVNNGRTLCLSCHRKTFKDVFKWRK